MGTRIAGSALWKNFDENSTFPLNYIGKLRSTVTSLGSLLWRRSAPVDTRCSSLDTACHSLWLSIQCGLTKQCIERWEKLQPLAGEDTEVCVRCTQIMKQLQETVVSAGAHHGVYQAVDMG